MTALIILFFVLAAAMFVLGCMDQRTLYWKISAWQYKNPEANEPSDAAFGLNRFGLFAGAATMVVMSVILMGVDNSNTYSTSQVMAVAQTAASELDQGGKSGIGSSFGTSSKVYDAVNEEGDGNVEIRSAGGSRYELTNRDGENPVCLTVEVENDLNLGGDDGPWNHSVTTSVDEGPC